jgi:hypothetical protein
MPGIGAGDIQIKIDLSRFKLEGLGREISAAAGRAIKSEMAEVVRDAKKNHRYISHTRQLEKSVVLDNNPIPLTAHAHLDTGIAFYGPYVHEGHGTHANPAPGHYVWNPDQFLYEALDRREPHVQENVERAIEAAIRKGT